MTSKLLAQAVASGTLSGNSTDVVVSSNGSIQIAANNGTDIFIAANNNVGIGGNTTPAHALSIQGSLYTSTNTVTIGTGTYFASSGLVGISNSSPNAHLHITRSNYYNDGLRIELDNTTSGGGNFGYFKQASGSYGDSYLSFDRSRTDYMTGMALYTAGSSNFFFGIGGVPGVGGGTYLQARNANGTVLTSLDTSGNFGIGNSSPSYKLHVAGTGYASSDFRAPIFYDSDNTSYYCDPASTSNFSTLNVGGNAVVTAGNITTYALPRRGLVVNQGNDANTYYYKIGLIDQNNGSFHVRGNIGGHDGPQGGTQGAASVDLSIYSRYGNIPVQGFVRGNIGNQDLQVYKDASNNVHVYVKTTVYALVDVMFSEASGGTSYFNPSGSTTTPASLGYTLVWQASSNQGTTTTGIQTAAPRAITKASMPAGTVLQVVSAVKKDTSTCNSTTFVDVSGLSLSITPTSSTSKILVIASVALGALNEGALRLLRDGILIDGSTATTAPSTNFTVSVDDGLQYATMTGTSTIYDSPGTTNPVTYKVQFASMYATGRYCYVNRYHSAWETTYGAGTTSTIIAMEIAQ